MIGSAARLCRLDEADASFTATASLPVALSVGGVTVHIDTSETIDVAAETARLEKDLAAARAELEQAEKKLGNPAFVDKAPEQVVAGIRQRHATAVADIDRITGRLAALGADREPTI